MAQCVSAADLDEIMAWQREQRAQAHKDAQAEACNPLGRHRWVRLQSLQATDLNGRFAEIVVPPNENDRFGVRVQGEIAKKLIRRCNLQPIPDEETVQVCRLASKGEECFVGGYIQDTRWPLAVLQAMPYQVSRLTSLLAFPLCVTRVEPRTQLHDRADLDNQWATYMMIEPVSGFAPPDWQSHVGPVVVWRPDGAVSSDDMALLNDFLSGLLEGPYGEGTVDPDKDLTPDAWAKRKKKILKCRRDDKQIQQYTDLHI